MCERDREMSDVSVCRCAVVDVCIISRVGY